MVDRIGGAGFQAADAAPDNGLAAVVVPVDTADKLGPRLHEEFLGDDRLVVAFDVVLRRRPLFLI